MLRARIRRLNRKRQTGPDEKRRQRCGGCAVLPPGDGASETENDRPEVNAAANDPSAEVRPQRKMGSASSHRLPRCRRQHQPSDAKQATENSWRT
jgi:hypothetical protein